MPPSGRRYAFETMPTCSPIPMAAIRCVQTDTPLHLASVTLWSSIVYVVRLSPARRQWSFSHSRGNALRVTGFQACSCYDTHSPRACGFSCVIRSPRVPIGTPRLGNRRRAGLARCVVQISIAAAMGLAVGSARCLHFSCPSAIPIAELVAVVALPHISCGRSGRLFLPIDKGIQTPNPVHDFPAFRKTILTCEHTTSTPAPAHLHTLALAGLSACCWLAYLSACCLPCLSLGLLLAASLLLGCLLAA